MKTLTAAFSERMDTLEEQLKKLKEQATTHIEQGKLSSTTLTKFNNAEMQLAASRARLEANQYEDAVYLFSRAYACMGEFLGRAAHEIQPNQSL